ncbi:PREDICTED: uncharacterized protein K02A2.6-like [Vollenhovia emeryi]|uniref:uncharacterized protein K02A2.6-like n=1 Tax=Vollenhovia emeryi TaxID=411798 RepID=UPI0005F3ECB2|nr:PREDICTED: uncharacterized protein K02A2.6-like [Vollenhovia emeryi]
MEALNLWDVPIAAVCSSITDTHTSLKNEVRNKFLKLFSSKLGKCNQTTFSLTLVKDAKVPFIRARPVPFGARKQIEDELRRLEEQGIISQINYAEAATHPLWLSRKKTGSNLDLSNAFLQVELGEEAKRYMNINTHIGLFQVNRMQPGVKTTPGQFQQLMDSILAGSGAMAYLDDIIIPGKGVEDHGRRLHEVLRRLENAGLTLAIDKCTFGQPEIKFLGKIIDEKGQRPDPEKLQAVRILPQPTDVTQLRAFLGAVNWYGSFLPHLKDLRGPLDDMLRKGEKFLWTRERAEAFTKLKQALHANLALTHYDPKKPLIVAADASSYGIGATLLHPLNDGSLRPVVSAYLGCPVGSPGQGKEGTHRLVISALPLFGILHGNRTRGRPYRERVPLRGATPVYLRTRRHYFFSAHPAGCARSINALTQHSLRLEYKHLGVLCGS